MQNSMVFTSAKKLSQCQQRVTHD